MLLDFIKNAYDTFEQLNISATLMIVAGVLLFMALLFAVREIAAWFFKIDDIKRDVRKLTDLTIQLETQIQTVQDLISGGIESIRPIAQTPEPTASPLRPSDKIAVKGTSFPIVH